ncbi:MAG: HtaA domain-containing protein [Corynebacterium sp.]|nr:HtaA domain-containing protein [Corynebacterium sp.]
MLSWSKTAPLSVLVLAGIVTSSFGPIPFVPAYAATSTAAASSVDLPDGAHPSALVTDSVRSRVYLPVETDSAISIGWFDANGTMAETSIALPFDDLSSASVSAMALSPDGSTLYVLGYREPKLFVVDLNTNTVTKTIAISQKFPAGMVVDSDSGDLYYWASNAFFSVDITQGTETALKLSEEKYPRYKDAVYDPVNKVLWVSIYANGVITAYSTITHSWVSSVAIPTTSVQYESEADGEQVTIGGKPNDLAIDPELGLLHVRMSPTSMENWTNDKLISINVKGMGKDAGMVGTPIAIGTGNAGLEVLDNHDVLVLSSQSNTLENIDSNTWTASTVADFVADGSANGTSLADKNSFASARLGDTLFVGHPHASGTHTGAHLSRLTLSEGATTPTTRPAVVNTTPEQKPNDPWTGPAAQSASTQPASAVAISNAAFAWSLNDYMGAWSPAALGDVTATLKDGRTTFGFPDGSGWYDPTTGAADIAWSGGVHINHYPTLAPDVTTTFGNPRLTINPDGTGAITVDLTWTLPDNKHAEGYSRVTIATFSNAKLEAVKSDGNQTTLRLSATPDYKGRAYTDSNGVTHADSYPADFINAFDESMQAWWMKTNASMSNQKVPNPFSLDFSMAADAATTALSTNAKQQENSGGASNTDTPDTSAPGTSTPGTNAPSQENNQNSGEAVNASSTISNAAMSWSLNQNIANGRIPFGGSNFLSAGHSDGSEKTYATTDGSVSIFAGDTAPTWATRAAYVGTAAGQHFTLSGGAGTVNPDGSGEITWPAGTVSVNYYGGLVPFWMENFSLSVNADGTGTLYADLGGYASSKDDPTTRSPLSTRTHQVVATFHNLKLTKNGIISATPDWDHVAIPDTTGTTATPQDTTASDWGAWPTDFVNFQYATGLTSYFYSAGDGDAPAKRPGTISLKYDTDGQSPQTSTQTEPGTADSNASNPSTTPATDVPSTATEQPVSKPGLLKQIGGAIWTVLTFPFFLLKIIFGPLFALFT